MPAGLRRNKADGVDYIRDRDIIECDVRGFDFEPYSGKVEPGEVLEQIDQIGDDVQTQIQELLSRR